MVNSGLRGQTDVHPPIVSVELPPILVDITLGCGVLHIVIALATQRGAQTIVFGAIIRVDGDDFVVANAALDGFFCGHVALLLSAASPLLTQIQ